MIVIQKYKPAHAIILQKFGAVQGIEALTQSEEQRALAWIIGPPGASQDTGGDPLVLVESMLNTGL